MTITSRTRVMTTTVGNGRHETMITKTTAIMVMVMMVTIMMIIIQISLNSFSIKEEKK